MTAGRHLDVGGIRTFVLEAGEGPTMVLLHGSGPAIDAHVTWHRVMPVLARRFHVIAPDQLGFGKTDLAADGRYRDRLERTPHVIATLDALKVRNAVLVGHSEGGFVALRIAIERPDLVDRLVVVTSGGAAPALGDDADAAWMTASLEAYDYDAQTRDEESFIASRFRDRPRDDRLEAVVRAGYRLAEGTGKLDQFRKRPVTGASLAAYARLQEEHLFPYLGDIAGPCLLVWAAGDRTVPVERGLKLMRMLPRADLHVFRHAGHMVMHDRADDFARLVTSWCLDTSPSDYDGSLGSAGRGTKASFTNDSTSSLHPLQATRMEKSTDNG